jgi:hypothetical protein
MTEMDQITPPRLHRTLESGLFFKLMRWKQWLRGRVPSDQIEHVYIDVGMKLRYFWLYGNDYNVGRWLFHILKPRILLSCQEWFMIQEIRKD